MTDWDKLWEANRFVNMDKIRVVGDAMQMEIKQLRKDNKDLAELGSDDLKKRIAYQKENEALKIVTAKLFNKLADEQQKLEAIREIAEPYRNHCIKAVDKILEVLGVLKEMQEKEQQ